MNATPLNEDIIQTFLDNFTSIKESPIVLYGIGDKTKLILQSVQGFHFIGLMDQAATGQIIYGYPVLSKEQVAQNAKYIIIVSNYASAGLIYSRVQELENAVGLEVYHLNGTRMKETECDVGSNRAGLRSYERLLGMIEQSNVVSFDLFDTLIMRYTLTPEDVFELVEIRWNADHEEKIKFAEDRRRAERLAWHKYNGVPDIYQIYEELEKFGKIPVSALKKLLSLEFEVEEDCCISREKVKESLLYAHRKNKKIIIVSDMYWPKEHLITLLERGGISKDLIDDFYVSCDVGKSKRSGAIWDEVEKIYDLREVLHIGDNPFSDGEMAEKRVRVFLIPGVFNMQGAFTYSDLIENSFMNRMLLGIFASQIFNSPFLEVKDDFRCVLHKESEVGFCFFAPLIKAFLDELARAAAKKKRKLLFIARDGYILEKIYRTYYPATDGAVYFLGSRTAFALAAIREQSDIAFVFAVFAEQSKYTYREFMKMLFDIDINEEDIYCACKMQEIDDKEALCHYIIQQYETSILSVAKRQREHYRSYFLRNGIESGDPLILVNFIGSGVTQKMFEMAFPEYDVQFYYFATTPCNVFYEGLASMYTVFQGGSIYTSKDNALVQNMVAGECIFTAPFSQFMGFDSDGEPKYAEDGKNGAYSRIRLCHEGIENYFLLLERLGLNNRMGHIDCELAGRLYGTLYDRTFLLPDDTVRQLFTMVDHARSTDPIICL